MSEEEVIETINNPGSDTEDGESSTPDPSGQTASPFSAGSDTLPTQQDEVLLMKEAEEDKPETPEEEDGVEEPETPTDKPEEKRGAEKRIKELLDRDKEKDARMEALERKLAALENPQEEEPPPYEDVSGKSNEEILEALEEDPLGFLKNFAQQVRYEVKQDMMTTQQETERQKSLEDFQSRAGKTYGKFAEDNPEFQEMWDNGKLKDYMDDNPGHNAMSAYREIKWGDMVSKDDVKKQIQKAIADTEKKFGARSSASKSVLKDTPSSGDRSVSQSNAELKDTNKRGGLISVIANRLERAKAGRM